MTVLFDRVIFALAAVLYFHPAGFNPTVVLHAVQHGIEHSIGPLDFFTGELLYFLNERVAVAFALREQGEDQWFGRSGYKFFCDHTIFFVSLPIHCPAMYVNGKM